MKKLCLALVCGFALSVAVVAQDNVSGILNKEFNATAIGKVDDLLGALLGGGFKLSDLGPLAAGLSAKGKGQIVSMRVTKDTDREMEVDIVYKDADISSGKLLIAEFAGDKKNALPIALVGAAPKLTTAAGTVHMAFHLNDSAPMGVEFKSKFMLAKIVQEDAKDKVDTAGVFKVAKKFLAKLTGETYVVDITPTALGAIPASDPAGGAPPPPKIFRPEIMSKMILAQPSIFRAGGAASVIQPRVDPTPKATGTLRISDTAKLRALTTISAAQGLPKDVADKGGKGPSSTKYRLFDLLNAAPGTGLTAEKITTINADVYMDANPASGIFYYLPARYVLFWDVDNGYALRMIYGAARPDGSNDVSITARLTSAIDPAEISFVRGLLQKGLPAGKFKELRPFPFNGSPGFSMKDDLKRFNIAADKISVSAISDIAGEVDLSFTTDVVTKENIEATLTQGLGLTGTATYTSAGEGDGFSVLIPVQIKITDPHTFGTRYWHRADLMQNTAPFPIKLKYLHFLTIGSDGTPTIYSYDLKNTELPPKSKARIADAAIQGWLDGKSLKSWADYGVVENYPEGVDAAKSQWTGGVANMTTAKVQIVTLTPFTDPGGIARIMVDVKSKYFDSKNRAEQIKSGSISADNQTIEIGPVYLVDRRADEVAKPGDPLFSYRYTIIKADGTALGPTPWTDGDRMELFLGKAQLKSLLGG